MLSAVENHFGPGRSYATGASHYSSSGSTAGIGANNNLIATPCPIIALPPPMSATEFARPHPKPNRFNGGQSLRNGLSSPSRSKYSHVDQSAPVNLTQSLNDSSSNGLSLGHKQSEAASLTAAAKPSSLESEQDAISSSIASLYQHKLAYCPPDATTQLYYQNFYGRPPTSSVYGTHSLYAPPSHALNSGRNPLHHGVAYPHVDSYSTPYLFGPTAYSPPAPTRPGLSPHSPIGTITVGTSSQNSTNSSISAQSVLSANVSPLSVSPTSLYAHQREVHQREVQQREAHQREVHQREVHQREVHQRELHQREAQYHIKASSQNEHNSSVAKSINAYRSESKDKEHKASSHLNGKSADFKIPSGKEGSLKHRILIRPDLATKPSQKSSSVSMNGQSIHSVTKPSARSSNSNGVNNSSSNNNNNASSKNKNLASNGTSNFSKGSLIELSTGELKRVEDMRTEDFVMSSTKNPNLQLIDTTVVKITSQSKNMVVITLSYNNNNKICFDTQPSHPFFVYGKGWASFSPESTLQEHGLKCQLLEVGDVCISLTPREQSNKHQKPTPDIQSPQNLSRKQQPPPHTIPTTATSTAVTSRPFSTFDPTYNSHLMQRHPMTNQDCALSRKYTSMAPPLPPTSEAMDIISNIHDDEAIDATMHSRKRRAWSTSEICDEKKNKPN